MGGIQVDALAKAITGPVLTPADAGYETARHVHNGLIDRRPAVIARCLGAADVAAAIRFAREHALAIAVRGGGHNVGGRGTVDGGLVIDLSALRYVDVDVAQRTARAGGGTTWGHFNRETQLHGLATTGGVVSSTGVGGLTLGGGFGWLMPKYGMSIDNLLSADLVLADGRPVRTSATEEPDLFWAIRGGGGNFGVATSLEFQLHEVGPVITGGLVAWPAAHARDVLRFFRDYTATLPDEVMAAAALLTGPDGVTKLCGIAAAHCGSPSDGEAAVAPLKKFGTPVMDAMGPIPYTALNGMLDEAFPRGARNYWKSHFFDALTDEMIDVAIERFQACPTPMGQLMFEHFHGAGPRVPAGHTAYAMRGEGYNALVLGEWLDPAGDEACRSWARQTYDALRPYGGNQRYINYLGDDESPDEALASVYGPNLTRLRSIKRRFDPENVFRHNVNIPPA
ncbi:MAG: FAD-binding oxidoreductase [Vicinamibacterales bacterium]